MTGWRVVGTLRRGAVRPAELLDFENSALADEAASFERLASRSELVICFCAKPPVKETKEQRMMRLSERLG